VDTAPRLRGATPSDLPAIEALLLRLELPTAGVPDWVRSFWVAEADGAIVGVAGVERHGDALLLRSVAVDPAWRGSGLGQALVARVMDGSRAGGAAEMFLLTTTAQHYFPKFGFAVVGRDRVPPALHASAEFSGACPASAIVMRAEIGDGRR
jgi:amino-acid N-acetyltransferase